MTMTVAQSEAALKQFNAELAAEKVEPPAAETPPAAESTPSPADALTKATERIAALERENQQLKSVAGNVRKRESAESDVKANNAELRRLRQEVGVILEHLPDLGVDQEALKASRTRATATATAEEQQTAQEAKVAARLEQRSDIYLRSVNALLSRHELHMKDDPRLLKAAGDWAQILQDAPEDAIDQLTDLKELIRDTVEELADKRSKKAIEDAKKSAKEEGKTEAIKERTRLSGLALSEPTPAGGTKSDTDFLKDYADGNDNDTAQAMRLAAKMGLRGLP